MPNSTSRIYTQILSESQIRSLGSSVGSKVLIEITNPIGEILPVPVKIGDKVGFESIPSIEFGYLTVTSDGYILRIDSGGEEIIEAYKYLQERVNEGCWLRFAPRGDRPVWYLWQSIDWKYNAKGILTISLN
jgi:hypothetical protein